jgi:uncharacterized membrane protein
MLSKPLIIVGLIFQIIGFVWGLINGFQNKSLGQFFSAPNWPIFLGIVILIIAVAQAVGKKSDPVEKADNQNNFPPQ